MASSATTVVVNGWCPPVWFCLAFTSAIWAVYLHTLSPGIAGGDAGELAAESCHLGTAHPPGYPLFTIVHHLVMKWPQLWAEIVDNVSGSNLFTRFLPKASSSAAAAAFTTSSPAWRANAFTALLDALCAAFVMCSVCLLASKALGSPKEWYDHIALTFAGLWAGAMLAFSPLIWQYAVTAEVFAMNNAFAAAIIYLTIRFSCHRTWRSAIWGAFICGLALTNQHTIILYEIPLISWVAMQLLFRTCKLHISSHTSSSSSKSSPLSVLVRGFTRLGCTFVSGLTPYLYLIISARIAPKSGSWGDVSTVKGFWHHFRRADYGSLRLYSGDDSKMEPLSARLVLWGQDLQRRQSMHLGLPLATIGIIAVTIRMMSLQRRRIGGGGGGGDSAAEGVRGVGGGGGEGEKQIHSNGPSLSSLHSRRKKKGGGGGHHGGLAKDDERPSSGVKPREGQGGKKHEKRIHSAAATALNKNTNSSLLLLLAGLDDEGNSIWLALVTTLMFYLVVFHSLANMPLKDPLLFGVHARFWQQPNILMFILSGVGLYALHVGVMGRFLCRKKKVLSAWLVCTVVVGTVSLQLWRNHEKMDQSDGDYFSRYARALLEPLPEHSIFLINNDQVWTSARYMQVCEGLRKNDVTLLNMSMMTFAWWRSKRMLYPHLVFPGTHYSASGRQRRPPGRQKPSSGSSSGGGIAAEGEKEGEGAFLIGDFVDANWENFGRDGRIFMEGSPNHVESDMEREYEFIPMGLAAMAIKRSHPPPLEKYVRQLVTSYRTSMKHMTYEQLPPVSRYGHEWWESTLRIIYHRQAMEAGAYLLEQTLARRTRRQMEGQQGQGQDQNKRQEEVDDADAEAQYIVQAAMFMERAALNGPVNEFKPSASLFKNLGLAYMHLVRDKSSYDDLLKPSAVEDVLTSEPIMPWFANGGGGGGGGEDIPWKKAAGDRFLSMWKAFLDHPDAKNDAQYETVQGIYSKVYGAALKEQEIQDQQRRRRVVRQKG